METNIVEKPVNTAGLSNGKRVRRPVSPGLKKAKSKSAVAAETRFRNAIACGQTPILEADSNENS